MSIRVPESLRSTSLPARPGPVATTLATKRPLDAFDRARSTPGAGAVLQRGSVGKLVTALQQKLHARALMSAADIATGRGVFGPRTEAAVRRFQVDAGLQPTGVVGPSTWAALARPAPRHDVHEVPTDLFTAASVDPRLADTLTDDLTEPMGMRKAAGV